MAVPVGDQRRLAEAAAGGRRQAGGQQATGRQAQCAEVARAEQGRPGHHGDGLRDKGQDRRA
eukprot:12065214-Alexandrium_andersonii.AAC.1